MARVFISQRIVDISSHLQRFVAKEDYAVMLAIAIVYAIAKWTWEPNMMNHHGIHSIWNQSVHPCGPLNTIALP